jgi:hypothetical protein
MTNLDAELANWLLRTVGAVALGTVIGVIVGWWMERKR